jgi:DNA alkylation damage repair protein AlkB
MEEWIQPPNTSNIAHQPQDLWKGYVNDMEARELRQSKIGKQSDLSSLRWVTLGRHYDWSNRKYTDYSNPFPAELGQLCKDIVRVVDHENSIEAQAAIINFYPKSSSMGGHQDDAEFCLHRPIVSISLGVACTFLLGGLTKDEKPLAILLTSGDAVVFGGESRLRYHGVPKVWTGDVDAGKAMRWRTIVIHCAIVVPPYFNFVGSTEGRTSADSCHVLIERQEAFWRFMRTTRININVRQVTSGCSLPTAQA